MIRYQRVLASILYKFFDRKSSDSGANNRIKQNQQLANELHKAIITKFIKRIVYPSFKDNIQGADFADMQLINKFHKGIRFLIYIIDMFSKYAWAVHLKDKKGITVVNAFQKKLDDLKRKPNKIWVDQGRKLYNSYFKMIWKCIQHTMKENLLLLKDLLEF